MFGDMPFCCISKWTWSDEYSISGRIQKCGEAGGERSVGFEQSEPGLETEKKESEPGARTRKMESEPGARTRKMESEPGARTRKMESEPGPER